MINNQSLSFEAVKQDLIDYVLAKPDSQKWKDFVGTSVGTTVVELLASVSTYKAFQRMVQRREAYLGTALLNTSVQELAFNRGYMQAPTLAATITLSITPVTSFVVSTGDVVGSYDEYSLIAYETKTFTAAVPDTLLCIVGNLHSEESTMSGVPSFQTYVYTYTDSYIASQFEEFTVDGVVVPLMSELNYLSAAGNDFMLRRVVNNVVKIYSGNGVVGYSNPSATSVAYRCITYGTVSDSGSVTFTLDGVVTSFVFASEASYGLSTSELRSMALYYPLDGRISQDRDYESAVIKFFGALVHDAYSWNDNPNQHIYLLVKGEAELAAGTITSISDMIDIRRQQGIQVFYHQFLVAAGNTLGLSFKLSPQYDTTENKLLVQNYLDEFYKYKFFKEDTTVSSIQLAIILTQLYGFPLYPASDQNFAYVAGEYIKEVVITWSTL